MAAPRSLPDLALLSELPLCHLQFRLEVLKPDALIVSSRADKRQSHMLRTVLCFPWDLNLVRFRLALQQFSVRSKRIRRLAHDALGNQHRVVLSEALNDRLLA